MDLYLVRHGVAFDADPSRWPDDSLRPLTAEGKKRFVTAARGLRELITGKMDVVLSSPWVRAWQTAELLEKEAGWPTPVACDALAGRGPAEVLQALQPYVTSSAIALVGHEPSLHQLASYLLTADTGHVQIDMKKGGVIQLELGEGLLRPGTGRLLWLLTPKILRALAP
jgi:phosphohistidine phosphatase